MEENTYRSFDNILHDNANITEDTTFVKQPYNNHTLSNHKPDHTHSNHSIATVLSDHPADEYPTLNSTMSNDEYPYSTRRDPHHGIIVDTYARHNQDWIIPRRVMCAFFWIGILLLFTGIVLMVTSKHQDGAYTAWGAVMLGLGFCLLLICFILCMHAYCVISDENDPEAAAPPMRAVPPPSPASIKSIHSVGRRSQTNGRSPHVTDIQRCYGSYNPAHTPSIQEEDEDSDSQFKVRFTLHADDETAEFKQIHRINEGYKNSPTLSEKSVRFKNVSTEHNSQLVHKHSLDVVGKLPSYNTACQMTQYSPQPMENKPFDFEKRSSVKSGKLQRHHSFDEADVELQGHGHQPMTSEIEHGKLDIWKQAMDEKFLPKTSNIPHLNQKRPGATQTSLGNTSRSTAYNPAVTDTGSMAILRTHSLPVESNINEIDSSTSVSPTNVLELSVGNVEQNQRQFSGAGTSSLSMDRKEFKGNRRRMQPGDDVSSDSPTMSVYDNVHAMWKPKSGSELKHFHF